MYRGRISGRQLSKWIQNYIVSHAGECCNVGKKVKVIREIAHLPDGSVVKKTTDGWVTISTIFQADALSEAFDKYDGEEPNWRDALVIIKKFKITFQCTQKEPHGEYLLVVYEFSIWDLQEGFSLKYDLTNCMWIPEVQSLAAEERKKMAEESQHRRGEFDHLLDLMSQYSQSQGPATVGEDRSTDTPDDAQETSASNNDRNLQQDNIDAPDHNGTIIPAFAESVLEQLRRPFSAQEFLIPESQWKVLEDLSDWQSQGVSSQSPRLCKSRSGNVVQFLGISVSTSDKASVVQDCKTGSIGQSSHRQKDAQPGTSPGQLGTSTDYVAVPGTSKQMEDGLCSQLSTQADVSAWHENIDSVRFSDESLDTDLQIDESYASPNKANRRNTDLHIDEVSASPNKASKRNTDLHIDKGSASPNKANKRNTDLHIDEGSASPNKANKRNTDLHIDEGSASPNKANKRNTDLHINEGSASPNKANKRNIHTDQGEVRQPQVQEHIDQVEVDHELSRETEDGCKETKELFKAVKLTTVGDDSFPLETEESSASVVVISSKKTPTSQATAEEASTESSASVVVISSRETPTSQATAEEASTESSTSFVVITGSSKESTQGVELAERTRESASVRVEGSPVDVGSSSEEFSQEKVGNQKDRSSSDRASSSEDSLDFGSPLAKSTQVDRQKSPSHSSHRTERSSSGNLPSTSDKIENRLNSKETQDKETPDNVEDTNTGNVKVSEPTPTLIENMLKISDISPSERHNKMVRLKNMLDKFQTMIGKTVQNLKPVKPNEEKDENTDAAVQGSVDKIDSVTSSSDGVISPSPEANMSEMSQLSRSILRGVRGKGCDNVKKTGILTRAVECDVKEKKTNDNVTESLPSQENRVEESNFSNTGTSTDVSSTGLSVVSDDLTLGELSKVIDGVTCDSGITQEIETNNDSYDVAETDVSRTTNVPITVPSVVRDNLTLVDLIKEIDGVTCDLSIKQEVDTDNDGYGIAERNKKTEVLENQDARGTRMSMNSQKRKPIFRGVTLKSLSNSSINITQKNAESVCKITEPVDTPQVNDRAINSIQQSNLNSPEDGLYPSTQPFEVHQSDSCGNSHNEKGTKNTNANLLAASPLSSPESQMVIHTQPFEVYPIGTQRFSPDQSCDRVHSSTSNVTEETSFVGYSLKNKSNGLKNKSNGLKNKNNDNSAVVVCKKRKAHEELSYMQNTYHKKRKGDIHTDTNTKIQDSSETLSGMQNKNPGEDMAETEKDEMTKLKEKQYAVNLTHPTLAKTLARDCCVDLTKTNQSIYSSAEKQRKQDAQSIIDLTIDDDTQKTDLTDDCDTQKTDITDDDTQKTDLTDDGDTQKTCITDNDDTQKTDTSSESHTVEIGSQENMPPSTGDKNEIETDKITIDGHSFGDKTQWMNFIDSPYQKSVSEPKQGVSKSRSTYNKLRLQKNLEDTQENTDRKVKQFNRRKDDRILGVEDKSSKAANQSSKAKCASYWLSKSTALKDKRRQKTDDMYEYPSSSTLTESNGSQSVQETVGKTVDSSQDSRSSKSSVVILSEGKQARTPSRSQPATSDAPAQKPAQEVEFEENNITKNCLDMFLSSLEVQPESEVGRRLQTFKLELQGDLFQDFQDTCKEL